MFGFAPKLEPPKPDPLSAQIKIASQRNERASQSVQDELEEILKMSDTMRHITGRMK